MILESVLSCSYLIMVSGSCIYNLRKDSYQRYFRFLPHFTFAFVGIASIAARSLIVLTYKLFFKEYTFDPMEIQIEEAKNRLRCNTLDHFLGTFSMASLIYSLYCHHGYHLLGTCIISGLTFYDLFSFLRRIEVHMEEFEIEETFDVSSLRTSNEPDYLLFFWVFFNGCLAFAVNNNYALAANYPYLLTTWTFPKEGFYQGWTMRRTINDYMMTAYVILMTEALRQTQAS